MPGAVLGQPAGVSGEILLAAAWGTGLATLQYTGPLGQAGRFELTAERTVIGRRGGEDAEIQLEGDDVSRRHACLTRVNNSWFLEDLGSRNHTYLNSENISGRGRRELRHGDRITICQHRFRYRESVPEHVSSVNIRSDSNHSDMFPSSSYALSRASSSHDAHDASMRLSVLVEITRALQNSLSLDEVLAGTLAGIFRIFPAADRGIIGFLESDGTVLPKWWKCRVPGAEDQLSISQTIVRQAISQKDVLLFDNIIRLMPSADSIHQLPVDSVICAPLIDASGAVFGVLQIDSSRPGGFAERDLELVAAIAVQVSLAIHMARLHETALQQQAIERDMENAREVQRTFLPARPPDVAGYEFASYYEPAQSIGGDYFDFVQLRDGRMAIVLADVGGKGIPAALYMARLASETRACLERYENATDVIRQLNTRLRIRLVTLAMVILTPQTHEITIVNAGHRPPFVRRRSGQLEIGGEDIIGLPFSVLDDTVYEAATLTLNPGDGVVMFSDGLEDGLNSQRGERFGISRVRELIASTASTAQVMVSTLTGAVREFTDGTPQFDDMCIVAFRRL